LLPCSIGDAVIVTDISGTIILFNKVAEQNTGWLVEADRQTILRDILYYQ
jgi:PAS domain-containing protein